MYEENYHILSNHYPIYGTIIGEFILLHGLFIKSRQTILIAYLTLFLSSLATNFFFLTLEVDAKTISILPDYTRGVLYQQKIYSNLALAALSALNLISIMGFYYTIKKATLARRIAFTTLYISLLSLMLLVKAGYMTKKQPKIAPPINQITTKHTFKNSNILILSQKILLKKYI